MLGEARGAGKPERHSVRFGANVEPLNLAWTAAALHAGAMGEVGHNGPKDGSTAAQRPGNLPRLMRSALPSNAIEHIVLAGFDTRESLLFLDSIGHGSRGAVAVDGPVLFALLATPDLAAIVLAHNHPSGDPTPSKGDILLTARIAQIARFASIVLIDHLIFGGDRHASFRALSLL